MDQIFYTEKDLNFELIKEIEGKYKKIQSNLEYPFKLKEKINKNLIEECNAHSLKIEDSITEYKQGTILRGNENYYQKLTEAWNWAEKKYNGVFSREFLVSLVDVIEPNQKEITSPGQPSAEGYRAGNVSFNSNDYISATNYQSIDTRMEELFNFLNNSEKNPLIRAIFGHLNLAKIHPFYDGNGRVSRIVQNLLLVKNGYLPICIERGQKFFYYDLLRGALKGADENNGKNLKRLFFEYLASKENTSLDEVIKLLEKNKNFIIEIPRGEKALTMWARNQVKHYFERNTPKEIYRTKVEDNKIYVTGNIALDQLKKVLDINRKKGPKISIIPY